MAFMEVKSLFDPDVKQGIVDRINKLTPGAQNQWGRMNAAQMLAHCQAPLGVAVGRHQLKANFFFRLIGPLFKEKLFNDKPFSHGLPTDASFKITGARDFEKEKQNLIAMVSEFSESAISGKPHPFFGKLTNEQWSKGTWKHLDHHLRQFGV